MLVALLCVDSWVASPATGRRHTLWRSMAPACSAVPPQGAVIGSWLDDAALHDVTAGRPVIDWYPGHIAKAERLMSEVLSMVDVVVELRDARIPISTAHPMLQTWIGSRGHVLALNRRDLAPEVCLSEWTAAMGLGSGPEPVLVDAKKGTGVEELRRAILEEGRWAAHGASPAAFLTLCA